MIKRRSYLNGSLENKIENFANMLLIDFGFNVKEIDLYYYDDSEDVNVCHLFFREAGITNCIVED